MNNLSSFTDDAEVAWEFGSSVWEVRVPLAKIVFFSGLLPRHLLGGEGEYLVLGGDYLCARCAFEPRASPRPVGIPPRWHPAPLASRPVGAPSALPS